MNNLQIDISRYKVEKSTIVNERQEIIKQFLDSLNTEREGTKWKPLSARAVAIKVGHIKTGDLYAFKKQCEQAKCGFGACFFYSLRVK